MNFQRADWVFESDDACNAHLARQSLRLYLQSVGACEEARAGCEIILGELLANVIRHAPGPVVMWVEREGHDRVLNVLDRGKRPWSHDVPLTAADHSEHGRGLLIAQKYAKSIQFLPHTNPIGTHVAAILPN